MEEEFFFPEGVMIENIGRSVGTDKTVEEENLPPSYFSKTFLQADAAFTDGLYFAPE
jgi:hypothetical protein